MPDISGANTGQKYYHSHILLEAVYAEGVRRISQYVQQEIKEIKDPCERLQAALEAHLDALLDGSDYVQAVIRVLPKDAPKVKVIVGGIVPDVDERGLLDAGVDRVFQPGSSLDEITETVAALTRESRHGAADSGDPL